MPVEPGAERAHDQAAGPENLELAVLSCEKAAFAERLKPLKAGINPATWRPWREQTTSKSTARSRISLSMICPRKESSSVTSTLRASGRRPSHTA
jgi:hypothetical protein